MAIKMSVALRSTNSNPDVGQEILDAFNLSNDHLHHDPKPVFEHGHWWINCSTCGAQFDAVDTFGGDNVDGFSFEEVTHGDDYCLENPENDLVQE
jgi:hypothetical protein